MEYKEYWKTLWSIKHDCDEFMEKVMCICERALEEKGYDVYGFSLGYEKFSASDGENSISVDFSEQ